MKRIEFRDTTGVVPEEFYPKPSKNLIPNWIKNLAPYVNNDPAKKHNWQTAKRCIPLLEATMVGYTIVTTEDIIVEQSDEGVFYSWKQGAGIEFHESFQLSTHSYTQNPGKIPKWMNPWSIKTPNGYSCLFVSPLNSDDLPVEAFSGVVDTDNYFERVNFPFMLKDPSFNGVIPAGTPIVQVFPFRRESWSMKIENGATKDLQRLHRRINGVVINAYRKMMHVPKTFK